LATPLKKKILVVDDNRVMLKFLINTLEREGHEVVSAENGFAALDIITSFTPNIMFTDLIMPNIGGDKLCRVIRKMPHLADCFLVIISAAVAEMELDFMQIDADTYIAKGPLSKMKEHVLAAVKESDLVQRDNRPKQIIGLDDVYARQVTKELLSRNLHLETILESISEGILEVYSKRIVYANTAATSLFGIPQEKLLGAYPPDLFDGDMQLHIELMLNSETDNPSEIRQDAPLELNNKQIIIKILPVKGESATTIMMITDVTERRRLQLQLQHVQKMEAIGTIASGIAHNFRNTLAGIMANNQVIQLNYKEDSEIQEITERIDTSIIRGVHLVDGLMQFSRKQIRSEFRKIDLSEVIQETYQIIKESFDRNIDIHIDVPELLPIMGDHSGLSTALMNLCTNARDTMPEGGELRINGIRDGDKAVVTVSDTGSGMDKNAVEKCFDPFFTTKEVGKGTGLGLSTTYGIIKSHEGEIRVNSTPNKGSVFKLIFTLSTSYEQGGQE
jgi:two-component system cell cycle sensor histidine kinase/response regulator CckA